jgi:hypothetical protein
MDGLDRKELRRLAIWRHHEASLEKASLLVALSRCRMTDREPLFELRARQGVQLIELLHEFCYHARKTIEIAETYKSGAINNAKTITMLGYDEWPQADLDIGEDAVPLTDQSLWWLLGRVIHSQEITVHEQQEAEVGSKWAAAPNITCYWTPTVLSVRSGFDGPDKRHYVYAERLVEAYCLMNNTLGEALEKAREAQP